MSTTSEAIGQLLLSGGSFWGVICALHTAATGFAKVSFVRVFHPSFTTRQAIRTLDQGQIFCRNRGDPEPVINWR